MSAAGVSAGTLAGVRNMTVVESDLTYVAVTITAGVGKLVAAASQSSSAAVVVATSTTGSATGTASSASTSASASGSSGAVVGRVVGSGLVGVVLGALGWVV